MELRTGEIKRIVKAGYAKIAGRKSSCCPSGEERRAASALLLRKPHSTSTALPALRTRTA